MKRALVSDRVSGDVAGDVTRETTVDRRGTLVLPGSATGQGAPAIGRTRVEVVVEGWRFEFEVEDADRAALRTRAERGKDHEAQHGPTEVRALFPGRVVAVVVGPGDVVEVGQHILTVEAMKMQNEVRAPRDGTVDRIVVASDVTIEHGDLLMVLA